MQKLFASLLSLALFSGLYTGSVIADADRLAAVLQAQSEETQARYQYRHPQETLEFFGIQPGMTVMEGLPGRGWYTRILVPYLGREGRLIEVDYALDLFPLFGFFSEEQLEAKLTWAQTWKAEVESWEGEDKAQIETFVFGSMPAEIKETADVVLMIRALHNLSRFEEQGGFLTAALQNIYDVLKPGGVVGVVQHWAPDSMSDEWAVGAKGYMKKAHVIRLMEEAGFQLAGSSDVNINPKDKPGENDFVWRLPPSLATGRDNPELAEQMKAIGESNRMTLKFRKP